MSDKVSKESVHYRKGTIKKHCANCDMYDDRTCSLVAGKINPLGLCDRWVRGGKK